MKLLHKFAIGLGLLLADIVLLCCCLYLTVIADRMIALSPDYLLWIGLVVICYFINLIIAKKGKSIGGFIAWNIIWMAITATVVAFAFQCTPDVVSMKIFVSGVLIAIEGHGIALSLLPQKASTQLSFFDALVVVFAIFLAGCHLKGLSDVIGLQIFGFICVGYTLVALIVLRTNEEGLCVVRGASVSSRVKVFGLLATIIAISCIICGGLTILAKNVGASLTDIVVGIFQMLKQSLLSVGDILGTFFSKLPQSQMGDASITGNYSGYPTAEETGAQAASRLPEWLLPLVGILVAAVILWVLIRLIYRLRKEKIKISGNIASVITTEAISIRSKKDFFFRRLLNKWRLRFKMYRGRKSPEGLAVLLRKSGKRIGVEMLPEDSWHGYATKLAPYGNTVDLEALSDYMKQFFYSEGTIPLSREQYQRYAACLKQLKKPESHS